MKKYRMLLIFIVQASFLLSCASKKIIHLILLERKDISTVIIYSINPDNVRKK